MALLVFTIPHDTNIPEAHYTQCEGCKFLIKFYYAGKKQDITKEIECPICHYKNKIRYIRLYAKRYIDNELNEEKEE